MASAAALLAAPLVERWEGCYLKPYLCPANVPTIGIGSTRYENGLRVSLGDAPITRDRALALMRWELEEICEPAVRQLCPNQPDHVIAALMDFSFNCGVGALRGSTLRKRINASDFDGATTELAKWTRGGGRVLPGLVKRRAAEALLISSYPGL